MLVANVRTKTMGSYTTVTVNEITLEEEMKLYDLELENEPEYMLLSVAEIKHIQQKGYLL